MPFALGVGRRVIILISTLVLVIGSVLCATAKNYEVHLAARCIVGLAAGQSEALVPMITQEMYFLHERSKYLMTQQAIQVIITTIYTVFASPIAGKITPEGWYGLGAGLAGAVFVAALLFLPETKYERPLSSYQEAAEHHFDVEETVKQASPSVTLCTVKPELDFVRYQARTFRSDFRIIVGKPDMKHVFDVYKVSTTFYEHPFPSKLTSPPANVRTSLFSQCLLGSLSQRSDSWCQHRHWHDLW
jgi:MFS family permease